MPARATIIRHVDWPSAPWRNGAGITHELAHCTDDDGTTLWRASVAEIEHDCTFSLFAGLDRHTILLSGAGVSIDVDGWPSMTARTDDHVMTYPGGRPARCKVLTGAVRVLNVMVDPERVGASIHRRQLRGQDLVGEAGSLTFLYCLSGSIEQRGAMLHRNDASYWIGPMACSGVAELVVASLRARTAEGLTSADR